LRFISGVEWRFLALLGRAVGFVFRRIEMVHRGSQAAKGAQDDSICGILKRFIYERFFVWWEAAEDVVAEGGVFGGADAEAESGEVLGAEGGDDGFEAVLAACGA
jgi:hypothetical protein